MTESKTRTRMKVLAGLVAFMFAALTTRLWFLQVLASDQFSKLADDNQVRLVPLQPLRGEIRDRDGNVLVGNRSSTIVTVDRVAMQGQEEQILYRLSTLLNIPVNDLLDRLNSVKYLPYQPVPVAEDVPKEVIFYIKEHAAEFPGVSYEVGAVRSYRFGALASHVLGWTGEISDQQLSEKEFKGYRPGAIVGKSGVEATYERYLHGKNGQREIQVNAKGRVLNENFNIEAAKQGDNVVLSIDGKVQQLAEQSLRLAIDLAHHTADRNSGQYLKATGGAVIVMDPRNGKVLALASNPTFDPSIFLGGLAYKEALRLDLCFPKRPCPKPSHNNPLLDRATQGLYPAGSTFKPFVATAALKEKIARPNGQYPCPAIYYAPIDPSKHPFHNWSTANFGNLSLTNALVYSCDTVFYKFGYDFWVRYRRSGVERNELMQRDLASMGFGRKTGIDLPAEQRGIIPDYSYVKRKYDSAPCFYGNRIKTANGKTRCDFLGWLPGDAINLSIGQGFMTVTPMQLAVGYSAIANGGTVYAPRVVDRIKSPDGDLVKKVEPQPTGTLPIPRRQVLFLRKALEGVTRYGTAAPAFKGFPLGRIPVAGKTGTADIIPQQPYSWFAAIAPADHPRYVVVGLVEQGGHGSTTAAPMVRRILEGLFGLNPPPKLQAGSVVD
jgi:penicillin-binding protein 2